MLEIEELKKRIEEIPKGEQEKEDELLASMSYQPGWEVFKNRADKKINALLEPGTDSKDLAFIGAVTLARELAITVIRAMVSEVESAKIANKVSKSEPEA